MPMSYRGAYIYLCLCYFTLTRRCFCRSILPYVLLIFFHDLPPGVAHAERDTIKCTKCRFVVGRSAPYGKDVIGVYSSGTRDDDGDLYRLRARGRSPARTPAACQTGGRNIAAAAARDNFFLYLATPNGQL